MLSNGLIDGIVPEPLGGAHRDPAAMFAALKTEILKHYRDLKGLDPIDRVALRMEKFSSMGVYENA
jgi:acetyl-CoA carboxylase carboxyl transferase subunit alpha